MAISELGPLTGRLMPAHPWLSEAKFFDVVDSTQSRIETFLKKDQAGSVLLIAERQSKGVGRQGRSWSSEPGGAWMTIAFPVKDASLGALAPFSLVSALQLAECLKESYGLNAQVKWPNDVLVSGKKIAGLLLSTAIRFKRSWLLLGIGVNINNEISSDLLSATSVKREKGAPVGRGIFIQNLIDRLWEGWKVFSESGFGLYQKAYLERLEGVEKNIQIKMGKVTVEGCLKGVDAKGGLLLQTNLELRTIQAGEILS